MKKNKFFAGVIVLLFVLSFSVSQLLLANGGIHTEVCENPIVTVTQKCAQESDPSLLSPILWNCCCDTMGPKRVTQWSTCERPAFPWE